MMTLNGVIAMALMLSISTASAHPSASARNQYAAPHVNPLEPLDQLHHPRGRNRSDTDGGKAALQHTPSSFLAKLGHSNRSRRSFTAWSQQVQYNPAPYPSITVWRAPLYPLSRPYYIPIYGAPGRIPVYFPPQAVLSPDRPFQGPMYLPPSTAATEAPTTPKIGDRFGDEIYFPADDQAETPGGFRPTSTTVRPTRRTTPRGRVSTYPPVVQGGGAKGQGGTANEYVARPERPKGPTTCVWAIVSCCTAEGQMNAQCFEARGCGSFFFDRNPCDSDFAQAALENALKYYDN